jgi:hypothetical protein
MRKGYSKVKAAMTELDKDFTDDMALAFTEFMPSD